MPKTTKKTSKTVSTPVVSDASALLGALTGKTTTNSKSKKPERPEVHLSPEVQKLVADFAPSQELADIFKEHADNIKDSLNEAVFVEYVNSMWSGKSQPTNPSLKVRDKNNQVDCEGVYIVQEKIKVQGNTSEETTALMIRCGVSKEAAAEIVENEIDFSPQVGLRSFSELVNGHYEDRVFIEASDEEKAVATKLLQFINDEFSEEEKALVLRSDAKTVVKKGFLARVAGYVSSLVELKAVFKVLQPVNYPKSVKFAVNDSPVNKTARLVAKASEILGTDKKD